MLELRPNCECCDADLPPHSEQAMICTFECTFCRRCATETLDLNCPNCGGNLVARPIRPAAALARYPASTERVLKPEGCEAAPAKQPTSALVAVLVCALTSWLLLCAPGEAQGDPGAVVVTHHETFPNPVFGSSFRVSESCHELPDPCLWDDPATWVEGRLPTSDTRVVIDGAVTIASEEAIASAVGIYPGGELSFDTDSVTRLRVADLMVFAGGELEIGSASEPVSADVSATVVFRDLGGFDPVDVDQILRGLVVVDGVLRAHGRELGETFLRLAAEAFAGDDQLVLETSASAAGWRDGDRLLLPKSSQCRIASGPCEDETESLQIVSISGDGRTVTLAQPLTFDHPGARDNSGVLDFLPHLLNTTRNVVLRSENPEGIRGHVLLHARSDVDLRYAAFESLGRTDIRNLGGDNQKGRYPLHAHHLIGASEAQPNGYQFTIVGNRIDFGPENDEQDRKWGLTVHASHYGLIERNIVDRASGAAIVTEDASETGNDFLHNFAVRVLGGNGERTEDVDPIDGTKLGRAGVGFWFNGGGNNRFEGNVAADVRECIYCYGFKFDNVYNGTLLVPTAQGDDPYATGGVSLDPYTVGLQQFSSNEAYAVPNGLTIWWQCTEFETPRDTCTSRVEDFHLWHHHRWGYFAYETNQLELDGFVHRGDRSALVNVFEQPIALELTDYMTRRMVVRNADIQGAGIGVKAPVHRDVRAAAGPDAGFFELENSLIIAGTGMVLYAPSSTNGANLSPQTTVLDGVVFDHPPERTGGDVEMKSEGVVGAQTNFDVRNDVWLYGYPNQGFPIGGLQFGGEDLYLVPLYQSPNRCDPQLGDCEREISDQFPTVSGARIYPLLARRDKLRLELSGGCPGALELVVTGATPDAAVAIAASSAQGLASIPGGSCSGTKLGLARPAVLTSGVADESGALSLAVNLPAGFCGWILQAVDRSRCATSSVAVLP